MTKATFRFCIAVATVLAIVIGGLSTASAEGAPGTGVITGTVKSASTNGGPLPGAEVKLQIYAHQSDGGTASATTDASGNFRFDKLSTDGTFAYRVLLQYQKVTYASDVIFFDESHTSQATEITVYESASDPSKIKIEQAHVIVSKPEIEQPLQVMEILIVKNDSDRVYISDDQSKGTLRVTLPEGAQNLQLSPELDGATSDVPGGFVYIQPLGPGPSEFMYAYELPFKSDQMDLVRSFDLPVGQLNFLVPQQAIKASSSKLETQAPVTMQQGESYTHLVGSDIATGAAVSVHLAGLPVPSPLSFVTALLSKWGIPGAIGVVFVGLVGFVLVRRRKGKEQPVDDFDDEDEDEVEDEDGDDEEPGVNETRP